MNLEMFYNHVKNRSSKRLFSDIPLGNKEIIKLLECASFAPSWCNVQPWKCYVAKGSLIDVLKNEFFEAFKNQQRTLELPYNPKYTQNQLEKKQKADAKLLTALNIPSDDLCARMELIKRNWIFFNAPQVLFLTIPQNLLPYGLIDLGCFLQNFLLAIEAAGLGACPQVALAEFPKVVRKYFPLDDTEVLICGVSFGNIKKNESINQVRTDRQDLIDFINIKETAITERK